MSGGKRGRRGAQEEEARQKESEIVIERVCVGAEMIRRQVTSGTSKEQPAFRALLSS